MKTLIFLLGFCFFLSFDCYAQNLALGDPYQQWKAKNKEERKNLEEAYALRKPYLVSILKLFDVAFEHNIWGSNRNKAQTLMGLYSVSDVRCEKERLLSSSYPKSPLCNPVFPRRDAVARWENNLNIEFCGWSSDAQRKSLEFLLREANAIKKDLEDATGLEVKISEKDIVFSSSKDFISPSIKIVPKSAELNRSFGAITFPTYDFNDFGILVLSEENSAFEGYASFSNGNTIAQAFCKLPVEASQEDSSYFKTCVIRAIGLTKNEYIDDNNSYRGAINLTKLLYCNKISTGMSGLEASYVLIKNQEECDREINYD